MSSGVVGWRGRLCWGWISGSVEAMESITSYFSGKPKEAEGKVIEFSCSFVFGFWRCCKFVWFGCESFVCCVVVRYGFF